MMMNGIYYLIILTNLYIVIPVKETNINSVKYTGTNLNNPFSDSTLLL